MKRTPEALLFDLMSAAGISLEHDDPFWYAVDTQTGGTLAQGADGRQVASEALAEMRRQYNKYVVAREDRSRSIGGVEGSDSYDSGI